MLITNGKKIVSLDMKRDDFIQVIEEVTENARELLGNPEIEFSAVELPYFHFLNASNLLFTELKEACGDTVDIQFRAIGDESVQLPGSRVKTVKHYFSPDEKREIADELCLSQEQKEELEEEKKAEVKRFKDKLDALENNMSNLARKHRMGYEERDKNCFVILDFVERVKSYIDKSTYEVVHTEELAPEDFQMRIDSITGFIPSDVEGEENDFIQFIDVDNDIEGEDNTL